MADNTGNVPQYIGARYVPLFVGEWDKTKIYEPLSIVQYQGNSYTSRQHVPTNIEITNEDFWAVTGNYNAQVEAYRQEVITEAKTRADADTTLQNNIDAEAKTRADADTTLQNNIDAEAKTRADADTTLQNNIDAEAKTRADADTTLQNNIDAEAKTRADADNDITKSINEEAIRATNAEVAINTKVKENTTQIAVNSTDIANNTANINKNNISINKNNISISNINNNFKQLIGAYAGYSTSSNYDNNTIYIVCSQDGERWSTINTIDTTSYGFTLDSVNVFVSQNEDIKIIMHSNDILFVDDSFNVIKHVTIDLPESGICWGINICEIDDEFYLIYSVTNESSDTTPCYVGTTYDNFNIHMRKLNINNNSISYSDSNIIKITLTGTSSSSHIDPYIIKYNNVFYLAVKDEIESVIEIYSSNSISNSFNRIFVENNIHGIEAPKITIENNYITMYGSVYYIKVLDTRTPSTYTDTTNNITWSLFNVDTAPNFVVKYKININNYAQYGSPIVCSYDYAIPRHFGMTTYNKNIFINNGSNFIKFSNISNETFNYENEIIMKFDIGSHTEENIMVVAPLFNNTIVKIMGNRSPTKANNIAIVGERKNTLQTHALGLWCSFSSTATGSIYFGSYDIVDKTFSMPNHPSFTGFKDKYINTTCAFLGYAINWLAVGPIALQ